MIHDHSDYEASEKPKNALGVRILWIHDPFLDFFTRDNGFLYA